MHAFNRLAYYHHKWSRNNMNPADTAALATYEAAAWIKADALAEYEKAVAIYRIALATYKVAVIAFDDHEFTS